MTSTMSMQNSGRLGLTNKMIGLIVGAFAVVEAVLAYFFVFAPLYIAPVYQTCADYNAQGITCMVSLFGKTLASKAEIANYQVILSLWDVIVNVGLIYIIMTGVTIALAVCMYKGMSFAKGYLAAVFGAKHIIGLCSILLPFTNMRRDTMYFGLIDSVVCIAVCLFFVLINSDEYAEDMLFSDEQISAMSKRMKFGFILYAIFAFGMIFTKYAMNAYGSYWSLYMGWTGNTAMGQGYTLVILLAAALIASITYVKEAEWGMFFYAAFGGAVTLSNLLAIVCRVMWIFKTYMPYKKIYSAGDASNEYWNDAVNFIEGGNGMTSAWWIATIMLVLSFVAAAVVTLLSFKKIAKKVVVKITPDNKKAAVSLLVTVGSVLLSFVLTMTAVTIWHKELYAGFTVGAMDYMYFFLYGGITLFIVLSMLGGYSFTKFGTLGLYLMVVSNNFISIFSVFSQRSARVAATAGYVGYNYIITAVLFILAIISCAGIIIPFVVKEIDDYMYEKRFS